MKKRNKSVKIILFILVCLIFGFVFVFTLDLLNMEPTFGQLLLIDLIIFVILFLICIINFIFMSINIRKRIKKLTDNIEIEPYLEYCNKKIANKRINKKLKTIFLLEKSTLLCLRGDFNEAIKILIQIRNDIEKQKNIKLKIIYFNNLMVAYIENNSLDKAEEIYESKKGLLLSASKPLLFNVKSALARYELAVGDPKLAKETMLHLPVGKNRLEKVGNEYDLGLADLKLGNIKEAKKRFAKIEGQCSNLYFYKDLKKYLTD